MIAISAQTRIACSDGKTLHSQNGQKKTFSAAAYYFQDDDNSRAFIFAK